MPAMLLEMKAPGAFKLVRFQNGAKPGNDTLRLVQREAPDVNFTRR
jgi:hypothetical protein